MVGNAGEWRTAQQDLAQQVRKGSTNTNPSPSADGNLALGFGPNLDHSGGIRKEVKVEFEIGRDSVRSFATQCLLTKPFPVTEELEPLPAAKRSIRLVIDQMPAN
jgi:hypothetical protein